MRGLDGSEGFPALASALPRRSASSAGWRTSPVVQHGHLRRAEPGELVKIGQIVSSSGPILRNPRNRRLRRCVSFFGGNGGVRALAALTVPRSVEMLAPPIWVQLDRPADLWLMCRWLRARHIE